jgi:hypothetical protein
MQAALAALPQQALAVWVTNTPVRSGNARRHTRLNQRTIQADYAYAQRLDEGWSQQSPRGMTQPTEKFIQQQMSKIMRM